MKIVEANASLTQSQSCAGLYDVRMTHVIKETKAEFNYIGPKFTQQMWNEILAYFKWTQFQHRSEAQVRLFVNPSVGWRAWAFPQKGNTGMTSTELPDMPEFAAQRAQFGDDWFPYGTVHHHCTAGAFQSGTDSHNEQDQEGLHITVGHIDKAVHDIHTRFYFKGCKFEPSMELFWDVGDEMRQRIKDVQEMFGIRVDTGKQAVAQMSKTCDASTEFPEIWKTNYIVTVIPPVAITPYFGHGAMQHQYEDQGVPGFPSKAVRALRKQFKMMYAGDATIGDEALAELLGAMAGSDDMKPVLAAIKEHNCRIDDLNQRFREISMVEDVEDDKFPVQKTLAPMEEEDWRTIYYGHGAHHGGC